MSAERAYRDAVEELGKAASMRPRFVERGKRPHARNARNAKPRLQ